MRMERISTCLRLGVTLALPVLFALPSWAQDAGPTADEVIQKSIDARGGIEKMKAVQTTRVTGKMVLMGGQMEAPFTMEMKRPSSMHMAMDVQGKSLVRAFDGTTAWTINPFMGGDDAQKLSEDETKDMVDSGDMDGPLVDYKSKGHTVELVGKEDVEGTPAYKLKINKKSGKTDYTFVDAKSFLPIKSITKASVQGQQMEIESYPSNYKPVSGVMTPHALEQKMNGQTMLQMTIDKVETNVPVEDAVFKMPVKQERQEKKESK